MSRSKSLNPRSSLAAALGARVRKLRDAHGWSQQDLADRAFISATRIAQIELATDPPNEALAADLDRVLCADDEINIAWFHMNRARHPDWVRPYIDLERRANRMRKYAVQLVPGILQTEAYAYTLLREGLPELSEDALKQKVEARISRRSLLEGQDPMYLWVILDEAILHRPIGDEPEVMRDQFLHLLTMADRPHIDLQVLPFEAQNLGLRDGSYLLLSFPDGPDLAYLEGSGKGEVVESRQAVQRYASFYDRLIVKSHSPEASWDLIRRTLKERYGCPPPSGTD